MRVDVTERLHRWGSVSWDLLRIAAVIGLILWGLVQLRVVVVPLLLGIFLASLGTPLEVSLERLRFPRLVATWIVTLVATLVVGSFLWFVISQVTGSLDQLTSSLSQARQRLSSLLDQLQLGTAGRGLGQQLESVWSRLSQGTGSLVQSAVTGIGTTIEIVAGLVLTVIVAFFLIKDGERLWAWMVDKASPEATHRMQAAGPTAWATLRRYLVGTAIVGVADATGVGIALVVLGVPLAFPLAMLMFAGAFFPLIGALVSGTVISLATFATNGLTDALIVAAVVIVVQQLEGDIVAPLVLGRSVDLHPLAILLGITAGWALGGIVGAFLAVPVLGVCAETVRALHPSALEAADHSEPA